MRPARWVKPTESRMLSTTNAKAASSAKRIKILRINLSLPRRRAAGGRVALSGIACVEASPRVVSSSISDPASTSGEGKGAVCNNSDINCSDPASTSEEGKGAVCNNSDVDCDEFCRERVSNADRHCSQKIAGSMQRLSQRKHCFVPFICFMIPLSTLATYLRGVPIDNTITFFIKVYYQDLIANM